MTEQPTVEQIRIHEPMPFDHAFVWQEDGKLHGYGLEHPELRVMFDTLETARRAIPHVHERLRMFISVQFDNGLGDSPGMILHHVVGSYFQDSMQQSNPTLEDCLKHFGDSHPQDLVERLSKSRLGFAVGDHLNHTGHIWSWLIARWGHANRCPDNPSDGCYGEISPRQTFGLDTRWQVVEGRVIGPSLPDDGGLRYGSQIAQPVRTKFQLKPSANRRAPLDLVDGS